MFKCYNKKMNINYQKLKSEMDSDGDFIVDQIISAQPGHKQPYTNRK